MGKEYIEDDIPLVLNTVVTIAMLYLRKLCVRHLIPEQGIHDQALAGLSDMVVEELLA